MLTLQEHLPPPACLPACQLHSEDTPDTKKKDKERPYQLYRCEYESVNPVPLQIHKCSDVYKPPKYLVS